MVRKEGYESTLEALYRNNESLLIISALLFFIPLFIGYIFSGTLDPYLGYVLKEFKKEIVKGELKLTVLSIFLHNLQIAIVLYLGGIIAIVTVVSLIFNGLFIGYTASKYPLMDFIILVLPHGVFEVPAIIIAGAAGFRLTSFIFNYISDLLFGEWYGSKIEKISYYFKLNYEEFEESLLLFGISVVLLFIAALIEANATLLIYEYLKGII